MDDTTRSPALREPSRKRLWRPKARSVAPPFHALTAEDTIKAVDTDDQTGLSSQEASSRLKVYGANKMPEAKRRGPVLRFFDQFNNVIIFVLLGAAVITGLLQHWTDTSVIVGVVLVNAIVGFIQEGRAERALLAVSSLLAPQANVLRNGHPDVVDASVLVPGDIVLLRSGDRVPADLRIVTSSSLQIQEASLTGESEAVDKSPQVVDGGAALGDRSSMAFAGTYVSYGTGRGVVVATGAETEIGRISTLLAGVEKVTTPLLREISQFGRTLTVVILLLAAVTLFVGIYLRDMVVNEAFLAAVGLAVAAIPEGLPAVMTITMALGVTRMAQRSAIIRKLPAVETLGSVTVICSDKTGTLTKNELTVQAVLTSSNTYDVAGSGYAPVGAISERGGEIVSVDGHPELLVAGRAATLCNDGEFYESDGTQKLHGNPTDGALLTFAMKAGFDVPFERQAHSRLDLIPFESEHKFMATLHHDHEGHRQVYLKGAPERIVDMCAQQLVGDQALPLDRDHWVAQVDAMASQGLRVLAIAFRPGDEGQDELNFTDIRDDFVLIALFGIIDPPRTDAPQAVESCQQAGIRVKMITGDHAATAHAIAARFGLVHDGVVSGTELDRLSDMELDDVAENVNVFARTTPEQKLRIVKALQNHGHVVAMTGDGVNDAPALKRADIGVSMGVKGTEAAKEAAEMVLADDNFATIVSAVEEGRTVYDNLIKTILFVLPTSSGEAMTIIAAVMAGHALPITPLQILWVNMVTMITLGLALAFERAETDVMDRAPRRPGERILNNYLIWRIVVVTAILTAIAFVLFEWMVANGASVDLARTVVVNGVVAGEIANLLNCRHIHAPSWTPSSLRGNRMVYGAILLVILFQLGFTYAPPLQELFDTANMDLASWGLVLASGVVLFVIVELEKAITRRLRR